MSKVAPAKEKKGSQKNLSSKDAIFIQGARMHNLRNVYVEIPRNKLTVVTGVSGSGKSSLTIDTLFAEGQRRYAESLSAYARQFLMRMDKPDVDHIAGLCPAVAIEQKVITRTPRSTVGSMTEIYEYMRLLYARIGKTISPISGKEVKKDDVRDVLDAIKTYKDGDKIFILSPIRFSKQRETAEEINILIQKGFSRLYDQATNQILQLEEVSTDPTWTMKDTTYLLIDRLIAKKLDEDEENRIADSISLAFYEGEGKLFVKRNDQKPIPFSNLFELDGIRFEEPVPNLFSFNNPFGACPSCEGYSQILGIDKDLVIPNHRLSVYDGAVAPWKGEKLVWWRDQFIKGAKSISFPIHKPYEELTDKQKDILWNGHDEAYGIHDFFKEVEQNLYKVQFRVLLSRYRGRTTCTACDGYRLRKEALYVKVNDHHIGELCKMPISELANWFKEIQLTPHQTTIAKRILIEINQRMETMLDVGLGYLTLDRLANSLSGGESQRIQLTRCLGSNLTNSLYILDEPSIGLHSRDTTRLIKVLKKLRDLGNTVVVVEHDEGMMRSADHIIDMGPLASHLGGEVVAEGNYNTLIKSKKSLTASYLNGDLTIQVPDKTRTSKNFIKIERASENNLKNIDVAFPLGIFTVVSGVSGSGKTTLIKKILFPALEKHLTGTSSEKAGQHKSISGKLDLIQQVEMVDQNPIGKSSRSNPVTYIKAWDSVRDLFSSQPLSKIRGYQPKHFSFNVDGGRCDACKGEGEQLVEMQFLADVHLTCESCHGKRFKEDVLEVQYKGKNIYDILEMSVDEALEFFSDHKETAQKLKPLNEVGLGYVKLGQSSNTLSGGEAQRVKLASFLGRGKGHQDKIMFIFDEPTTGLHFHDINKLLTSFNALIEQGHTVIVIEHNIDVIKSADWLIELGPEAGDEGGNLVYEGVPLGIKKIKKSQTAPFL
ncbi:MAG: excinuclease ABC subunit A [Chitinophagia bacterium]|nr:excinuclease ABC subunit A [Chitinophagia bacterium]